MRRDKENTKKDIKEMFSDRKKCTKKFKLKKESINDNSH